VLALNSQSRLALREPIVLRSMPDADRYYAFDLDTGDQFALNETAYWVLEQVGDDGTLAEICRGFAEEFGVGHEVAREDVNGVAEFALQNGIIEEASQ